MPQDAAAARSVAASRVEMSEFILPSDANGLGTAFGGRVMQWTDLAAAMAAMRHARRPVVTASIDQLNFLRPIRLGELAIFRAHLNAVFGSSMEVEVNVTAEEPATGERRHCCEAFLTFVALGPSGRPARAPALLVEGGEEERRAREAAERRSARLARRRKEIADEPAAPG
jgi:acyl-CoA hydrolase